MKRGLSKVRDPDLFLISDLDDVVVGGGLVESFAFTSTEVPLREKGQATVSGCLGVEALRFVLQDPHDQQGFQFQRVYP